MITNPRRSSIPQSLKKEASKVGRKATVSPLVEDLTRLGYLVRGLVYGVIGVLALEVATGRGGKLSDTQGAIATLGQTPVGGVLLYVILVGLVGYALWGITRAGFDLEHKGSDSKGILERVGYAVSGISYGLLAYATYGLITAGASAARNGAQGAQTQQATASILTLSWGPWAVGLAGLIVIGIGAAQIVKGLHPEFHQQFRAYALSHNQRIWIERLGQFGTAARGLVFSLIGVFLLLAAYRHDPQQARGFDGVLTALLHQPAGPWLLGIVALGLIAFGTYSAASGALLRLKR
jgi:hypothetical protein